MKLKKTERALIIALVLSVALSGIMAYAVSFDNITDGVLRLHILANSDSEDDQRLKLKVRDNVLGATETLFSSAKSKKEAVESAEKSLSLIESVAEKTVSDAGFDYSVRAYITNMHFDSRTYDGGTLPAGDYDAVRIVIGSGKGHNWWCIMFPSVCVGTATDNRALTEALDSDSADIVENQPKYKVRFYFYDLFKSIFS